MSFEKGHRVKNEKIITKIELDEDYRIEIDSMGNHTLFYQNPENKSQTTIGYYSNVASALKSFRNELVNDGSKYTIKEYIDKMEEFNEYMEGLIKWY